MFARAALALSILSMPLDMDHVQGVTSTISGYSGGDSASPT